MDNVLNSLFTIVIAVLTVQALLAKGQKKETLVLDKWARIILVSTIFILAFLIRFIRITELPIGINQDGAMAGVDAKALADYGTDRFGIKLPAHLTAWGYGQMSSLLSYLLVPFIKVLGLNAFSLRFPVLLVSMLGMVAVFFLCKRLFDENTALIALIILAINPWHFMQSRWALDCNLFPHFFAFGAIFLAMGIEKKVYLYISMVFFALCMYAYGVSFYMVPFFLISVCIYLFIKGEIKGRDILICVAVYLLISWPIYGTMLINFFRWKTVELPFVTMPFFENSIRSSDILFFSENIGETFHKNLNAMLNTVFLQSDDYSWNTVKGFGTVYRCMLPIMILGGVSTFRNIKLAEDKSKRFASFIVASWWSFSVLLGLIIRNVNVNRINIVFYANILFIVAGFEVIRKKSMGINLAAIAVYMVCGIMFINTYFTQWQCNFWGDYIEALEYVKEEDPLKFRFTSCDLSGESKTCTEILMMFVFEMDSAYYRGEKDSFGTSKLPYKERFKIGNLVGGEVIDTDSGYVVPTDQAYNFPDIYFDRKEFNTFTVLIPKK